MESNHPRTHAQDTAALLARLRGTETVQCAGVSLGPPSFQVFDATPRPSILGPGLSERNRHLP
jgi:hypothetical protein